MALHALSQHLARRDPPAQAQALLGGLVLACLAVLARIPPQSVPGERVHHLSVLGHLLPEAIWDSGHVYVAAVLTFALCAGLWWLRIAVGWTAPLTAAAAVVLGSWRAEREYYALHQLFAPTLLLILLAAGSVFERARIAAAGDRYWGTALVPRWVTVGALITLGWGYSLSGLEKLRASGWMWLDGRSLRIWMADLAAPDNPIALWLMDRPTAAVACQSAVWVGETFALPLLLHPRTRLPAALLLLSFHLALELTLHLSFFGNEVALLVLGVLGPLGVWTPRNP